MRQKKNIKKLKEKERKDIIIVIIIVITLIIIIIIPSTQKYIKYSQNTMINLIFIDRYAKIFDISYSSLWFLACSNLNLTFIIYLMNE